MATSWQLRGLYMGVTGSTWLWAHTWRLLEGCHVHPVTATLSSNCRVDPVSATIPGGPQKTEQSIQSIFRALL